ncbi:MAG: c-type cytochrome [Pseudomonadota bacterium]
MAGQTAKSLWMGVGLLVSLMALNTTATAGRAGQMLYESKGCVNCHGTKGREPIIDQVPQLAGKAADYLETRTLIALETNADHESQGCVEPLAPKEVRQIAEWLSSLRF